MTAKNRLGDSGHRRRALGVSLLQRGAAHLEEFRIAFVLGPLLEDNFRQSLLLSQGSLDNFVRNEICLIFWCLTVVAVVLIVRRRRRVPGTE